MANAAFKPTDEHRKLVEMLAGCGIDQDQIALVITNPATGKAITAKTLRKCFRLELDTGSTKANAQVVGAFFKNCTTNMNVSAQIFWLKCRMGWKPPAEQVQVTGKDGAETIRFDHGFDLRGLSPELLAEIAAGRLTDEILGRIIAGSRESADSRAGGAAVGETAPAGGAGVASPAGTAD